jgi:peptidyl-prolyl cis-trans isomerase SurA
MILRSLTLALFLSGLLLVIAGQAPAQAQTRVVALVNDEPLTNFQVGARAKFLSVTSRRPNNAALRDAALDELIEEQLKLQEAKRLGIEVEQGTIDNAYGRMAQRMDMNGSQLTRALKSAGVDPDTLRRRIRADLAWRQVVQARFRQEVRIREQDVIQAMGTGDATADTPQTATEYDLQQVVVIVPRSASEAEKQRRQGIANQFRSRFSGCSSTQGLVQQYRDVVFRQLGKRTSAQFGEEDITYLNSIPIGGLGEPRERNNGLEMVAVCNKREIEDDTAQRQQVENQLMSERGNILARRLLIDLRQSAIIDRR